MKQQFLSNCSSVALTAASTNGRTEVIKLLLKRGVSVHSANQSQMSPLICAVRRGHWEIVDILLFNHASLEETDRHGRSPLMLAAGEGHLAVLEVLLSKGEWIYRGQFHRAAYQKNLLSGFLWLPAMFSLKMYVFWPVVCFILLSKIFCLAKFSA